MKYANFHGIPWPSIVLIVVFLVSAVIVFMAIPWSWAAQTTMEVYQQKDGKIFGIGTSLDIFDNPKLGGQKLVAPFSEGAYDFAVYNNSASEPLPYALDIEAVNPDNIPLVISLEKNGTYIFGGAGIVNMLPLTAFHVPDSFLGGNGTDIYTVKWAWKTDSDAADTAIGNVGTQLYTLIITAIGIVDEIDTTQPGVIPGVPGVPGVPPAPASPDRQTIQYNARPDNTVENQTNPNNLDPENAGFNSFDPGGVDPDNTGIDGAHPDNTGLDNTGTGGDNPDDAGPRDIDRRDGGMPATGDSTYIIIWLIVFIVCTSMLFLLIFIARKKRNDDNKTDSTNM